MALPDGFSGKESICQCRRHKRSAFIPESGRSPGEGNGNPLQYSCLGSPMGRGAWGATVHGVAKSSHRVHFAFIVHHSGTYTYFPPKFSYVRITPQFYMSTLCCYSCASRWKWRIKLQFFRLVVARGRGWTLGGWRNELRRSKDIHFHLK